jgi:DNA repair protein RadC
MPITDWPKDDQPRQKLLKNGAENLTDAELLAILFQSGTRGLSALDMAKSLLATHQTLKSLVDTAAIQQKGMGIAKHATLQAAIELGKRYLAEPLCQGQKLNNSRIIKSFLTHRLGHLPSETFACLFMNNHFQLLKYEELFRGTVNQANIYPREIVRHGLKHNAVHIILAHNHPSGSPTPSLADKEITQIIRQALALVDMNVADHVVVTAKECFSFAENGLL